MGRNWVEVDDNFKVTAHRAVSDGRQPTPESLEVLNDPPYDGGTYDPVTKRVTGVPIRPISARQVRINVLKGIDKADATLENIFEVLQILLRDE